MQCCKGGSGNNCLVLSTEFSDKVIWPPQRDSSAGVSKVGPSSGESKTKFLLTRAPKQIITFCMGKKISHDPVVCLDTAPQIQYLS